MWVPIVEKGLPIRPDVNNIANFDEFKSSHYRVRRKMRIIFVLGDNYWIIHYRIKHNCPWIVLFSGCGLGKDTKELLLPVEMST